MKFDLGFSLKKKRKEKKKNLVLALSDSEFIRKAIDSEGLLPLFLLEKYVP